MAMTQWKPIETAPEGRTIMVWSDKYIWRGNGGVCVGFIHPGERGKSCNIDGSAGPLMWGDNYPTMWAPYPEPPATP